MIAVGASRCLPVTRLPPPRDLLQVLALVLPHHLVAGVLHGARMPSSRHRRQSNDELPSICGAKKDVGAPGRDQTRGLAGRRGVIGGAEFVGLIAGTPFDAGMTVEVIR
jgi:hypothetical protein